ncbi:hypothetical protein B4135_1963 [Caldibacillus debilis]|uniref:Uncharacterized protein n=1 Tax=Caldibacillus debilis TaxID=301148 RepID=A0A150M6J3_9BACI|nr:hypothetical protein B4135_1963 [Caldibacillus debilis]
MGRWEKCPGFRFRPAFFAERVFSAGEEQAKEGTAPGGQ